MKVGKEPAHCTQCQLSGATQFKYDKGNVAIPKECPNNECKGVLVPMLSKIVKGLNDNKKRE